MNADQDLDQLFRSEGPFVRATLTRLTSDFDLAEDAVSEAFEAALRQWPTSGIPENPRAWLIRTARHKAIDALRRSSRHMELDSDLASPHEALGDPSFALEDDILRMIFTCCHPSLSREAQVSLTLREVCGLTTEEIAKAYLVSPPTLAQRIVRAKAKIRADSIPYEVPAPEELPTRLQSVLSVAYLLFNEGYYASSGEELTRQRLSDEAIRLILMVRDLLPDPRVNGLLALMLLGESRRQARFTKEGDLVLLEDQDRSSWNHELIARAARLLQDSKDAYTLQARIALAHAQSASAEATNWGEIVRLYDALLSLNPSPVVELNRSVAVAMRDGPEAALHLVDSLLRAELVEYGLAHATRADFLRRLGRVSEAKESYQRALDRAHLEPEKRFLERRLKELEGATS